MKSSKKHWVCDCTEGFIYRKSYKQCLWCGKLNTKSAKVTFRRASPKSERNQKWIELYQEGMSPADIANLYGTYRQLVTSIVTKKKISTAKNVAKEKEGWYYLRDSKVVKNTLSGE